MTRIESLVAPKGKNPQVKDSLTLKSIRELRSFRVRENEYEIMFVFLGNTICIYKAF